MNDKYTRQYDLIDSGLLDKPVTMIGAGGIGSWTALVLAKMGCTDVSIYDGDKVEMVNTASQLYGESSIGIVKAMAIGSIVKQLTGIAITPRPTHWVDSILNDEIIITGLDSMEVRRKVWEGLKHRTSGLLIDGRMSGDVIHIFIHKLGTDSTRYEKTLLGEPEPEACTGKAVVYNTSMIGSLIANLVKHYIKNEDVPTEILVDLFNFEVTTSYAPASE